MYQLYVALLKDLREYRFIKKKKKKDVFWLVALDVQIPSVWSMVIALSLAKF